MDIEIIEKNSHSTQNSGSNYCKVCGNSIPSFNKLNLCRYCNAPVCKKDISCGFCLNCYVNLTDKTQKVLKFFRIMIFTIPFLLIFILIYKWILSTIVPESEPLMLFLISLFLNLSISLIVILLILITLFFLQLWLIIKNPKQFFSEEWRLIIITPEYQDLIKDNSSKRYIPKERIIQIEHLIKKVEEKTKKIFNKTEESIERNKIEVIKEAKYYLIDKPCPICQNIIQVSDFCPECHLRFCPDCGIENNPYSRKCICGYEFQSIEIGFIKKFNK